MKKLLQDRLIVVIVITTILVITLGGTIRIYDAGESCPDWPLCFGTFGFDISEEEQGEWWEENPDEIDSRGSSHRYTTFEIFTEWIHRFLAGVILAPLVILNWFILTRDERGATNPWARGDKSAWVMTNHVHGFPTLLRPPPTTIIFVSRLTYREVLSGSFVFLADHEI